MSAVPDTTVPGQPASRATLTELAILAALCLVVFNGNLRFFGAYDSLAASFLPFEILAHGSLRLDRYAPDVPPPLRYAMTQAEDGHWVSGYPIVTPLLALPAYVPLGLVFGAQRLDVLARSSEARLMMEKLAASLIATASVVFVFGFLRRTARRSTAWLLAVAYAFGTTTWTISSQALWQHGTGEMLLAAALLVWLRAGPRPGTGALLALGALAGLITANRPHDLMYSAALAALVLAGAGQRVAVFLVPSAAIGMVLLAYNLHTFGTPLGGYVGMMERASPGVHFGPPSPAAIAGLLVSNRGLFTFSPFLLLLFRRPSPGADPAWLRPIGFAAMLTAVVFYSCFSAWFAGYCYGPRYLLDGVPWLIVLLAAPYESLAKGGRVAFVAAVVVAVGIEAVGAVGHPGLNSGTSGYGFWTVARSAPVLAARSGLQSPHFLIHRLFPGVVTAGVLPDAARVAELRCDPGPREWATVEVRRIRAAVTNRGDRAWSSLGGAHGRGAVRLHASWEPRPNDPASAGSDAWLALRLKPGESIARSIVVVAPKRSGEFALMIELAQFDGARWVPFPSAASPPCRMAVRVGR